MTLEKNNTSDREIVITRLMDAPRELVWEAMADPKQAVKWWGPNGFTNTTHTHDFRVGGRWEHTMHGPDGTDYPNKSVFKEIAKYERVVFAHGGGRADEPAAGFEASWTFEALKNKTRLTLRMVFPNKETRDTVVNHYNAIEGGMQTLNRLAIYLAKVEPFVISRTFDAPRELVWKAWTEPERMAHWWGPKGCRILSLKMDFRKDGVNHYCMEYAGGAPMWGLKVYRHIEEPAKIVFVDAFSDEKGGLTRHPMSSSWPLELLTTIRLIEENGKTTVDIQWLPIEASEEERKAFDSGRESMKQGWGGCLDQLAVYLEKS